jgi:hypothetical protein
LLEAYCGFLKKELAANLDFWRRGNLSPMRESDEDSQVVELLA